MRAITLMYHDVVQPGRPESSGFPAPDAARYKLTVPRFREHLKALRASAASSRVSLLESPLPPQPAVPVLLTFDDGGVSFYDPIAGLLEREGWRGHFFIATGFLDRPGFLTAAQVRELRGRGHVIGAHSCSHPVVMSSCDHETLNDEWRGSVETLSAILGEPVRVASVPGGYYSPAVGGAAARAGIRVLFTSEPVSTGCSVDGCLVLGRFTMTARTPAATCAALAAGRYYPQLRQQLAWGAKKIVKRAALPLYLKLRARMLGGNPICGRR